MPKKNAFFCYMEKRKSDYEKEGKVFKNGIKDVVELAGQEWPHMSQEERQPYIDLAKGSKVKGGNQRSSELQTSASAKAGYSDDSNIEKQILGLSIEEADKMIHDKQEKTIEYLTCIFDLIHSETDPKDVVIVLIHFTSYCTYELIDIPAEVSMLAFSLKNGVIEIFQSFIDPGVLPEGSRYYAAENGKKYHLPWPPFSTKLQNIQNIFDSMDTFLERHIKPNKKTVLFSLEQNLKFNERCLQWMANKCDFDAKKKYFICPLIMFVDRLLTFKVNTIAQFMNKFKEKQSINALRDESDWLVNKLKSRRDSSLNYTVWEEDIRWVLTNTRYATIYSLGCPFHAMHSEGIEFCTSMVLNGQAYGIFDILGVPLYIAPIPGIHSPKESLPIGRRWREHRLIKMGFDTQKEFLTYEESLMKHGQGFDSQFSSRSHSPTQNESQEDCETFERRQYVERFRQDAGHLN